MSRTILADVDGFTPCIDAITQQYGIMISAVFGKVWRYCQMERGVCDASIETIANELNLSTMTVYRHVKILVRDGFLEDRTPGLRHKPHTYADTGKAGLRLSLEGKVYQNVIPENEGTTNCDTRYNKLSDKGITNCQLKIGFKKEVKKEKTSPAPKIGAGERKNDHSFWKPEILLLAETFARSRGCSLPALSGPRDFKQVNKRWKAPLVEILEKCGDDQQRAARVVKLAVQNMVGKLTFDAPDQIIKTASSMLIDLTNGKLKIDNLELSEEEQVKSFLASLNIETTEDVL